MRAGNLAKVIPISRASFAAPGSKRPKTIGLKVSLRRVDLDGLVLVARSFRRKGVRDCDTPEKLISMLARTELVTLFPLHHKRGLSLGQWELERMNGSRAHRYAVRNA